MDMQRFEPNDNAAAAHRGCAPRQNAVPCGWHRAAASLVASAVFLSISAAARAEVPKASVTVGVFFEGVYDIDNQEESVLADLNVWTLQSDSGASVQEQIVFRKTRAMERVVFSQQRENGTLWTLGRYHADIFCDLDLTWFPFDKHLLKIQFRDPTLDASQIAYRLDVENSMLNPNFRIFGWRITDFYLSEEDVAYATTFGNPGLKDSSTFRWITASIVIERDALFLFFKLLTGGYVSFAAAMLASLMKTVQPPIFSGRLIIQIGALFSALVNNRAADAVLGRDDMMTLPNMLHLLIYLMILFSMALTLRSRSLVEAGKEEAARRLDRRGTLTLVGLFVLSNLLLIGYAAGSGVQSFQNL